MPPLRVVSLLPSATELIVAVLEAAAAAAPPAAPPAAELVGRSHECDFPPAAQHLPMLTASKISFTTSADVDAQVKAQLAAGAGLYSVDAAALAALRPDVVVTQSLCKVCSVDFCLVDSIADGLTPRPTVVDTNPMSLEDVFEDLKRVGAALGLAEAGAAAAAASAARAQAAAAAAERARGGGPRPCVLFCEWVDPIFCGGHWSPQLIRMAGGAHPLNEAAPGGGAPPSFEVPPDRAAASDPDVVIIAPCGLDLAKTRSELAPLVDAGWFRKLRAVHERRVWLVDGNQMFNRPGPRLVDALEWLVAVLHNASELAPAGFPAERWAPGGGV